jgi:hypothetical protein
VASIPYSIVENCRRLSIDTREHLEDVLTRLPGMIASDAADLTPAIRLRTRKGKRAWKAPCDQTGKGIRTVLRATLMKRLKVGQSVTYRRPTNFPTPFKMVNSGDKEFIT